MPEVTLNLPETALRSPDQDPRQFARDLRVAAAVHWYSRGEVSQGKAAEIAGMTRAQFIDELSRQRVDVVQVDAGELRRELARG